LIFLNLKGLILLIGRYDLVGDIVTTGSWRVLESKGEELDLGRV